MRTVLWIALIIAAAACLAASPGCTVVMPSHAAAIDLAASNAVAFDRFIQADPNVPIYVKTWVRQDANDWDTMSKWARGQAKTPTAAGK
jgi:hypothetical protein